MEYILGEVEAEKDFIDASHFYQKFDSLQPWKVKTKAFQEYCKIALKIAIVNMSKSNFWLIILSLHETKFIIHDEKELLTHLEIIILSQSNHKAKTAHL